MFFNVIKITSNHNNINKNGLMKVRYNWRAGSGTSSGWIITCTSLLSYR